MDWREQLFHQGIKRQLSHWQWRVGNVRSMMLWNKTFLGWDIPFVIRKPSMKGQIPTPCDFCCQHLWRLHPRGPKLCRLLWNIFGQPLWQAAFQSAVVLYNYVGRAMSLLAMLINYPCEIKTLFERFSSECRKTKTKVITLTNHSSRKQSYEPIRARSKYMSPVRYYELTDLNNCPVFFFFSVGTLAFGWMKIFTMDAAILVPLTAMCSFPHRRTSSAVD